MWIASVVLPLLLLQGTGKLEVKDTQVGKGLEAQVGDVVTVDYTGTLLTGKQFDSSVGKQPFTFQLGVGQVIKGWDQGVVGMKIGGSRELVIPSDLAYGEAGAGEDIPANSTLKFTVKLISIEPRAEIKVLKEGTGVGAKIGDQIEVHYKGTLKNGKEFDSSYKRSKPIALAVGQRVIPGFTQGLLGIKLGEKRKVVIPAKLAYGSQQIPPQTVGDTKAGSIIPANSVLTFELECVKLTPKEGDK